MSAEKPAVRIDITKDGPYIVHGGVPLSRQTIVRDEDGVAIGLREVGVYPQQETYALCRCGLSSNKPFCDGTHVAEDFRCSETASHSGYLEHAQKVEGSGMELFDEKPLCASAGFCQRGGGVWDLTANSKDPENRALAIEEVCLCPSGRLVMIDTGNGQPIEPDFEPSIVILEDEQVSRSSAIYVRGSIPVFDPQGEPYQLRNRVTLCRCGESSNKPFCDGSHYRAGFADGL